MKKLNRTIATGYLPKNDGAALQKGKFLKNPFVGQWYGMWSPPQDPTDSDSEV